MLQFNKKAYICNNIALKKPAKNEKISNLFL